MNTVQKYVGKANNAQPNEQTALHAALAMPLTPFQAALLFLPHNQQPQKPVAYAAFFRDGRLVALEHLHNQRGHNPTVDTKQVIRLAGQHEATRVILATWVRSASETPYAVEFWEEVEYQFDQLASVGLELVDNLRLSTTGMYSYYGDHNGPYSCVPAHCDKSINLHYRG